MCSSISLIGPPFLLLPGGDGRSQGAEGFIVDFGTISQGLAGFVPRNLAGPLPGFLVFREKLLMFLCFY